MIRAGEGTYVVTRARGISKDGAPTIHDIARAAGVSKTSVDG